MNIDLNKKVAELTPQEAIYLGKKASGILDKEYEKQYVHQEYPKYIAEFDARVTSEEEEEALRKAKSSKPPVKEKEDKV